MSMALIPRAHTTGTVTSSWRESTYTTMRPLEEITCPELSWWTLSQAPWTLSALAPSARSFVLTILCLVSHHEAQAGKRPPPPNSFTSTCLVKIFHRASGLRNSEASGESGYTGHCGNPGEASDTTGEVQGREGFPEEVAF